MEEECAPSSGVRLSSPEESSTGTCRLQSISKETPACEGGGEVGTICWAEALNSKLPMDFLFQKFHFFLSPLNVKDKGKELALGSKDKMIVVRAER